MKKVYISSNIPSAAEEILKEYFQVDKNSENKILSKDELIKIGNEYDAVISSLTDNYDEEVLSKSKKVKIYANYAVGYNNFDVEYAKKNGIIITNTPDVLSDTTAEIAWALLFAVSRRIVEADKFVRDDEWKGFAPQLLLGKDIYNKTLGIIGAGRIGHRFAEKARGYHMNIIYHNRNRALDFEKSFNANFKTLEELLKESDIISIHVPLTDDTYHMIGKKELELMKNDAILINTSRGAVIDEKALASALAENKLFGAGLDVFEDEPHICEKFLKLKNIVLTPHIGSASEETRTRMAVIVAKNVANVLNGEEPLNSVY